MPPMSGQTWIFGYGSLIWKQGFPFAEARPAWIRGWERRFWQGSTDHRGDEACPGRVVTLVRSLGAVCRGVAFLVRDDEREAVLETLDHRERGGYCRLETDLFVADDHAVPGLVYLADETNPHFLGPAPEAAIAQQVRRARGLSGPNAEYVRRLAGSLRELGAHDPHVYTLEALLTDDELPVAARAGA